MRACLIAAFALFSSPAAGQDVKRVLMLHSFGARFSPFSAFARDMRAELVRRSPVPLDIYEASLETVRFAERASSEPFLGYLLSLFKADPPDLIVTIGGPAASFGQAHRERLFPTTPMLITALEERSIVPEALTAQDALLPIRLELPRAVEDIQRLLPDTDRILVVLGNTPLEVAWAGAAAADFERYSNEILFEYSNDLDFEALTAHVATLPAGVAVLFGLMLVDVAGIPHETDEALVALGAASAAPVFGLFDSQLGKGIVGGPLVPVVEMAQQGADVAVQLLRGTPPSDLRLPATGPAAPRFDARQLARWNISEDALPPGSKIDFREPTAWERYRWVIAAALGIVTAESALILALLVSTRRLNRSKGLLRQSEERLSLAADGASVGLWVMDLAASHMWLSETCRSLLGFGAAEQVALEGFIAVAHPQDRASLRSAIREAMPGDDDFEAEYRLLDGDGDGAPRWVVSRGRIEVGAPGEPATMRGVTLDITARRSAEEDSRLLSGRLIHAQEDERARLARELHDDVTQRLAMLAIEAARGEKRTADGPAGASLGRIRDELARLSEDVHELSYRLHPSMLRDLGLEDALRIECDAFARTHDIAVSLAATDLPDALPADVALCLYRVMQEALRNVARHSGARKVRVEVGEDGKRMYLRVADGGAGFDAGKGGRATLGLASMKQRAQLLGGRLQVESAAGRGTTITVSIPLEEGQDAPAASTAG